jgi:hypothetical protein
VAALQLITDAVENPGDGEATGQSPETSEQTPVPAAPQPQSAAPPPAPEPAPEPAPQVTPVSNDPRHQARPRRHKRNSDQLVPRQVPHRRTRTFGSPPRITTLAKPVPHTTPLLRVIGREVFSRSEQQLSRWPPDSVACYTVAKVPARSEFSPRPDAKSRGPQPTSLPP